MITRGYIVDIDYNKAKCRIRTPFYDGIEGSSGSTNNDNLAWASIMWTPGIDVTFNVGDAVIVGYEDGSLNRPIILGFLKIPGKNNSQTNFKAKDVTIGGTLNTSTNVSMGTIKYIDLWNVINKH